MADTLYFAATSLGVPLPIIAPSIREPIANMHDPASGIVGLCVDFTAGDDEDDEIFHLFCPMAQTEVETIIRDAQILKRTLALTITAELPNHCHPITGRPLLVGTIWALRKS